MNKTYFFFGTCVVVAQDIYYVTDNGDVLDTIFFRSRLEDAKKAYVVIMNPNAHWGFSPFSRMIEQIETFGIKSVQLPYFEIEL